MRREFIGTRLALASAIGIAMSSCAPYAPTPDATASLASAYGREPWPVEQQVDRNVRTMSGGIEHTFRIWEQEIVKPAFFGGKR
jgi:hypothetical protein